MESLVHSENRLYAINSNSNICLFNMNGEMLERTCIKADLLKVFDEVLFSYNDKIHEYATHCLLYEHNCCIEDFDLSDKLCIVDEEGQVLSVELATGINTTWKPHSNPGTGILAFDDCVVSTSLGSISMRFQDEEIIRAVKESAINPPYIYCLCDFDGEVICGLGDGTIWRFNEDLYLDAHSNSVSQVSVFGGVLYSSGIDGRIFRWNNWEKDLMHHHSQKINSFTVIGSSLFISDSKNNFITLVPLDEIKLR